MIGCGGALAVVLEDLDPQRCLLRLTEKGGTIRWQPISPTLASCLVDHAAARGAVLPRCPAAVSRRPTRPSRRHDHLWHRLGQQLPWVAAHGVSTHWLRHTTLTWVERHYGYGIARAYAGHTDTRTGSTTTYVRGQLAEVATALATLTNEPTPSPTHPLSPTQPGSSA